MFLIGMLVIVCSIPGCIYQSQPPGANETPSLHNATAIPTASIASSVTRRPPDTFTGAASGTALAYGDSVTLTRSSPQHNAGFQVWAAGNGTVEVFDYHVNYYHGKYTLIIPDYRIVDVTIGKNYTFLVQDPGENDRFELGYDAGTGMVVGWNEEKGEIQPLFSLREEFAENGTIAMLHVARVLDTEPSYDDRYRVLNFTVEAPYIGIDPIEGYVVGDTVSIHGTTNFQPGGELMVSAIEGPGDDDIPFGKGDWSIKYGIVTVQEGPGDLNSWEFVFNSTGMHPNWYYADGKGITASVDVRTTFTLGSP
jgi:hypothetical protein